MTPLARLAAGAGAVLTAMALGAMTLLALLVAALGEDGEGPPDLTAGWAAAGVLTVLVLWATCVGIAWLCRAAVTGNAGRPTWPMSLVAPALYLLALASIFVRP